MSLGGALVLLAVYRGLAASVGDTTDDSPLAESTPDAIAALILGVYLLTCGATMIYNGSNHALEEPAARLDTYIDVAIHRCMMYLPSDCGECCCWLVVPMNALGKLCKYCWEFHFFFPEACGLYHFCSCFLCGSTKKVRKTPLLPAAFLWQPLIYQVRLVANIRKLYKIRRFSQGCCGRDARESRGRGAKQHREPDHLDYTYRHSNVTRNDCCEACGDCCYYCIMIDAVSSGGELCYGCCDFCCSTCCDCVQSAFSYLLDLITLPCRMLR